jgi:hypothetical protein
MTLSLSRGYPDNWGMRVAVAVLALMTSACTHAARLYPIEGEYSRIVPPVVIQTKMTGAQFNGDISFTLPDGPKCKGEWANAGVLDGSGGATVMCSDGRRVDIEFRLSTVGTKSGHGKGKDTKGNVYRFVL